MHVVVEGPSNVYPLLQVKVRSLPDKIIIVSGTRDPFPGATRLSQFLAVTEQKREE